MAADRSAAAFACAALISSGLRAVCFLTISCRCFSFCLTSRRSRSLAERPVHHAVTLRASDENNRPNENCVARMSDSTSNVRMTMIEPVRLSESARSRASTIPR